jgi:hypothetical protein
LEWSTDTHHIFVEEDKLLVKHIVLTLALMSLRLPRLGINEDVTFAIIRQAVL